MGASTGGSPGATTTNPIKIVANIFISFIGAGVLGLPFAVKEAGVFQALVVMTAVAFLSIKAMLMLIDCKYKILESQGRNRRRQKRTVKKSGVSIELNFPSSEPPSVHVDIGGRSAAESLLPLIESSFSEDEGYAEESAGSGSSPVPSATSLTQTVNYGDIGHVAFGPVGRTVVDLTLTVSQFGFCCAYLIFITENLTHSELLTKIQCLTFLLPLLFGLTLLKDLSRLAVFSLLAQISSLFAFAVVFWFDFQHYHYGATHVEMVALKGFPFYFAVAIYCYEGQGLVLSLEESLSPSIRHKFRTYFVSTLAAVTILYLSFGVSGYLSFGPATNAIITNNLPHSRGLDFAVLVKTCLCFSLFFTYPIMMFPVLQLLEKRQPILKQNHFGGFMGLID
ncbi:unnamed protein product [Cyprideis torosa]|uniref:Amino acid transporter transmembrane domain-containing protein n=1 Tax=Cyprideis torosa TaxID=163714 RepID=A0A7R8ZKS7_9CRUS|nr:unnamed protein product [Cyprideis torosa]CAG0890081.1 unnamed protein product [Cyprideis torosa]